MLDCTNLQWEALNSEIIRCRVCPRLVAWRESVSVNKRRAYQNEEYWGKPVPGFGDTNARVLVVGLAPGAHGSNRTGRMFTGDASGDFLYPTLFRAGFSSQPKATHSHDDLKLHDLYLTAVCRCAPPDNKPSDSEILACQPYLLREIKLLSELQGFVALGKIAFDVISRDFLARGWMDKRPEFRHSVLFQQRSKPWLLASYHPSRQNTQTGRLTQSMFDSIWVKVAELLARPHNA